NYIRVTHFVPTVNLQIRITDTTLFCPWFFTGATYNAFSLIRNTTNSSVNVNWYYRDANGVILLSVSTTLSANGSVSYNPVSAANLINVQGTIELTHNGAEGAIVANTTVLSGASGLSFDAPFV